MFSGIIKISLLNYNDVLYESPDNDLVDILSWVTLVHIISASIYEVYTEQYSTVQYSKNVNSWA